MPTSLFHPPQSFLVVRQLAKGKCTCKGAVCDIWIVRFRGLQVVVSLVCEKDGGVMGTVD